MILNLLRSAVALINIWSFPSACKQICLIIYIYPDTRFTINRVKGGEALDFIRIELISKKNLCYLIQSNFDYKFI